MGKHARAKKALRPKARRRAVADDDPVMFQIRALVRETTNAVLVRISDHEHWLPRSHITLTESLLMIPRWLARKQGLGNGIPRKHWSSAVAESKPGVTGGVARARSC